MDFIDDNFRWRVSVGGVSVGAVTIVPLAAKFGVSVGDVDSSSSIRARGGAAFRERGVKPRVCSE
jgi:hypothetical protein